MSISMVCHPLIRASRNDTTGSATDATLPAHSTTEEGPSRPAPKKPRQRARLSQFGDLKRRVSEFSTSWGEDDVISGYLKLIDRYKARKQYKEWSTEEIRSVLPDRLDAQLVKHFEQDLMNATTILLEAVRDRRFVPVMSQMDRMSTQIRRRDLRRGNKLDAAPGHTTPSVAELMSMVQSGDCHEELADHFGLLFRSILPNHQSRRDFVREIGLLPEHSEVLGLAGSATVESTDQDGMAEFESEDGGEGVSSVSTDWLSLPWERKVQIVLSVTGTAKVSGKAHLLGRAAKLRESLGSSLQRQKLYQAYLKTAESEMGFAEHAGSLLVRGMSDGRAAT